MNIVSSCVELSKKIRKVFQLIYFILLKKPLYFISFNSNGNKFLCDGRLFNSSVMMQGKNNSLIVKNGCKLFNTSIAITGEGNQVVIENGVVFSEGGRIRVEDNGNKLYIGEGSHITNTFFSIADTNTNVIIGKKCLFSAAVILRTTDSHSIYDLSSRQRINYGKDITIGDRVWIGYGCTILKGSVVEHDSIIGTQSILSNFKGVPNSIIVGSPAKTVKENVYWGEERELKKN